MCVSEQTAGIWQWASWWLCSPSWEPAWSSASRGKVYWASSSPVKRTRLRSWGAFFSPFQNVTVIKSFVNITDDTYFLFSNFQICKHLHQQTLRSQPASISEHDLSISTGPASATRRHHLQGHYEHTDERDLMQMERAFFFPSFFFFFFCAEGSPADDAFPVIFSHRSVPEQDWRVVFTQTAARSNPIKWSPSLRGHVEEGEITARALCLQHLNTVLVINSRPLPEKLIRPRVPHMKDVDAPALLET